MPSIDRLLPVLAAPLLLLALGCESGTQLLAGEPEATPSCVEPALEQLIELPIFGHEAMHNVTVARGLAFVGSGLGLEIYAADPVDPRPLGHLATTEPYFVADVEVEGGLAYIANRLEGLWIADVSDPAHPVELSLSDTGIAWDVELDGTIAYIASGTHGLVIADVSNPSAPAVLSSLRPGYYATGVEVRDGIAVVAHSALRGEQGGLRVIDVRDPLHPIELGAYRVDSSFHDVEAGVDVAYVVLAGALEVLGLADPANPISIATLPLGVPANPDDDLFAGLDGRFRLDLSEAGLNIAAFGHGVFRVDVRDPRAPRLREEMIALERARDVTADEAGTLWIAADRDGLYAARSGEGIAGRYHVAWGRAVGVALAGNIAYVATDLYDASALQIFDVSKPDAPAWIGTAAIEREHLVSSIQIEGTLAHVCTQQRFLIFDVEDPARPELLGSVALLPQEGPRSSITSCRVAGDFAYAATAWGTVQKISIANSRQPTLAGEPQEIAAKRYYRAESPPIDWTADRLLIGAAGNDRMYLGSHAGLVVLDVAGGGLRQLNVPVFADDDPAPVEKLALVGDTVWSDDGRVIELSLASDPVVKNELGVQLANPTAVPQDLFPERSLLLAGETKLELWDVSSRSSIAVSRAWQEPARAIAVGGRIAVSAGGYVQLRIHALCSARDRS